LRKLYGKCRENNANEKLEMCFKLQWHRILFTNENATKDLE